VLQRLADARLVTTAEGTAEVAHEALIREWPTLREWLTENRDALRLLRHLTEAAHEWESTNSEITKRDESVLYRGAWLLAVAEWRKQHEADMNESERAFLDASVGLQAREQQEREERRREKEEQQARELQAAQKLAETERRRADSERRASRRQWYFSAGLAVVMLLALAASCVASGSRPSATTFTGWSPFE